jgi:hypothetical protein
MEPARTRPLAFYADLPLDFLVLGHKSFSFSWVSLSFGFSLDVQLTIPRDGRDRLARRRGLLSQRSMFC